jgi:hypothetical protein
MLCKLRSLWWTWELQQQLKKFIFSQGGQPTAVPHQSYNMILQVKALQPIRLTDMLITWGITNKYQDWFYRDRTIKGNAWSSPPRFFLNFGRIQNCCKTQWPKQYNSVFRNCRENWEENSVSTLSLPILQSQLKPSAVYGVKVCNFQSEGYGVVPGQSLSFLTFFFLNIHFVFLVLLAFYLFSFKVCECKFVTKYIFYKQCENSWPIYLLLLSIKHIFI